jgi:hypothetical protein
MFSEREEKILKILGKQAKTIQDINLQLFAANRPFDSSITIANSIARIIKKCDYYKLKWTLKKFRKDKKLYIKRSSF